MQVRTFSVAELPEAKGMASVMPMSAEALLAEPALCSSDCKPEPFRRLCEEEVMVEGCSTCNLLSCQHVDSMSLHQWKTP